MKVRNPFAGLLALFFVVAWCLSGSVAFAKPLVPLRTAWLGEHETFLVWYAREKGWDKAEGLDLELLPFESGKNVIDEMQSSNWAIAGVGAMPALTASLSSRLYIVGIGNDECLIYPETLLENIVAQIAEHRPDLVVIDSIQTIYTDLLDSSAGSVSQIRECAATLLKYAKSTGTSIFIIGHITKDGSIAGPKILEHIVDVVLQFEGDSNNIYRILRGIKNRFGATFEIGVFEMLDAGLRGVDNPSEILLTHYEEPLSGIAVGASADGVRPYLIEVQALVSGAAYGTPQRSTTGYDARRMNMLLAVLEKRVGMKMFQKDVFLNFAGGFKVADPGLDLAVVAAVISSYYDRPVAEGVCCAGEIGLSGEVRPAPRTEQRISEAARLGFRRIIVSGYLAKGGKRPKGIEVVPINSVDQLPKALFTE